MNQDQQPRTAGGTTVYRGRTVEELLPRIREELGPDAIVIAQREGLAGGVGGFFQHPYVEVEARPGGSAGLLDTYDGEEVAPDPAPATRPDPDPAPMPAPAVDFAAELQAAALLDEASRITAEAALSARETESEAPAPQPQPVAEDALAGPADKKAAALVAALVEAGLPEALAADVIAETVSHAMPFGSPRQLKRQARATLARRIPVADGFRGRRRAVAVVGAAGAGKTLVASRLAAAYAAGSDLPARLVALHSRDGAAGLRSTLAPLGVEVEAAADPAVAATRLWAAEGEGLAVVDTPAVPPNDPARVAELAADLRALALDEVHLALPATLSAPAAAQLLDGLAALGVTHLVLTHSDETAHVGPVVALAVQRGMPFSFVSSGDELPGGLLPADPVDLASRLLA